VATKTDAGATEWAIDDEVFRLRQWGTDIIHLLPRPPVTELEIGAAGECALCLLDESNRVSRRHARIQRERAGWVVHDLGSKNGIRLDGVRRPMQLLQPGLELGIGGLTLIAESRRLAELRSVLARLLGWGDEQVVTVDLALRALRLAAASRSPLALCGDGDLVPIAQAIHRHTLGNDRPFILCDPRRRAPDATVRTAANIQPGLAALVAAQGGSLCVLSKRLPRDFAQVRAELRAQHVRVQLIVCMQDPGDGQAFEATRISIPPLETRRRELPRIIDEYAAEALRRLSIEGQLRAADRAWIASCSASSLPEIEKGTRRIVAVRHTGGNITAAAEMLGMSAVALRAWLARRECPDS
jgi:pSer/pThr/pTyr-binding forkhead associated (FHA) protein